MHYVQWPWRARGGIPMLTEAEGLRPDQLPAYNTILLTWIAASAAALVREAPTDAWREIARRPSVRLPAAALRPPPLRLGARRRARSRRSGVRLCARSRRDEPGRHPLHRPGCPCAYSAIPALTVLQWRYGEQLRWRHVIIGLTEERRQYDERGYSPLMMAQAHRRFAPLRDAVRPPARARRRRHRPCLPPRRRRPPRQARARVARCSARCSSRSSRRRCRSTPTTRCATRSAASAASTQRRSTASARQPEVTEAYEADRAEARTAAGSPTEFQGKAADTDGAVRYTAPSLVFTTEDGRSLEAGGFQPLEAYDVTGRQPGPDGAARGSSEPIRSPHCGASPTISPPGGGGRTGAAPRGRHRLGIADGCRSPSEPREAAPAGRRRAVTT